MSVQCVMSSCGCAHIVVFGMRLSPMYYQFWNQCTLFNPILCDINLLTALIIQVMHGMGTAFVLNLVIIDNISHEVFGMVFLL